MERPRPPPHGNGPVSVNTFSGPLLAVDVEVERRAFAVGASFELEQGERLALFGASGAGKTTILESIAGLTPLRRGTVRVDGVLVAGRTRDETALPARYRQVALVRQPTTLFPHLTAGQNVRYGARGASTSAIAELVDRLGIGPLVHQAAAALSGGQRQRVALGRALASRFRVLLLDEPFSAVDVGARGGLRDVTIEVTTHSGAAAILVTHDLTEAQRFGGRLGIIDEGRILVIGEPRPLVTGPSCRRVAELVGYAGFAPAPNGAWYAIHPDRVLPGVVAGAGLILTGKVLSVHAFGPRYDCELAVGAGMRLSVHLDEPPLVGAECTVTAVAPPIVAS